MRLRNVSLPSIDIDIRFDEDVRIIHISIKDCANFGDDRMFEIGSLLEKRKR